MSLSGNAVDRGRSHSSLGSQLHSPAPSRSVSVSSLNQPGSRFSLPRSYTSSVASSCCSVDSHVRRQVYYVNRDVLLAKAGYQCHNGGRSKSFPNDDVIFEDDLDFDCGQTDDKADNGRRICDKTDNVGTAPSPPLLQLAHRSRKVMGTISLVDLMIIAKGGDPAMYGRSMSKVSLPGGGNSRHNLHDNDSRDLGDLGSLGPDLLNLGQFLQKRPGSSTTKEWTKSLPVTTGSRRRFAAGSHGSLNLQSAGLFGSTSGSLHHKSLDKNMHLAHNARGSQAKLGSSSPNVHKSAPRVHESSPRVHRSSARVHHRGPPNGHRGPSSTPPSSPTSFMIGSDEELNADDEESWLSILSPSAAKSLRALDGLTNDPQRFRKDRRSQSGRRRARSESSEFTSRRSGFQRSSQSPASSPDRRSPQTDGDDVTGRRQRRSRESSSSPSSHSPSPSPSLTRRHLGKGVDGRLNEGQEGQEIPKKSALSPRAAIIPSIIPSSPPKRNPPLPTLTERDPPPTRRRTKENSQLLELLDKYNYVDNRNDNASNDTANENANENRTDNGGVKRREVYV